MTSIHSRFKKIVVLLILSILVWQVLERRPDLKERLLGKVTEGWTLFQQTVTQTEVPAVPEEVIFQGYVEGEFVHVGTSVAGHLKKLAVQRGEWVKKGESLFDLDTEPEAIAVREAQERLQVALARRNDLQKGQRPLEISVIEARLTKAKTDLELAKLEQARYEKLYRQKVVQEEALDTARAATQRNEATLQEVMAQLQMAKLAAREDLIVAAEAEIAVAQTVVEKAQWWLAQKQVKTSQAGQVVDVFYYEGEWVPAGNPVLSLLPPIRRKVRFFVPETLLGGIEMGQQLGLRCDGCAKNIVVSVSYVSPQAEYTPPVIYSRENRAKLVYMVEAVPVKKEEAMKLHPGQPVEVVVP